MPKKNQKGGDGYVINPNISIGGMPGHNRYSYNLVPVFDGDLLEQSGGHKDMTGLNDNCGCAETKDPSVFNLIQKGGVGVPLPNITQFSAIKSISSLIMPLGIQPLVSLILLIFVKYFTMTAKIPSEQVGGYISNLEKKLVKLGKSNLIVLSSLLLLHHGASSKKTIIDKNISKILSPLGMNDKGDSNVLLMVKGAFRKSKAVMIQKGGNPLKELIAPLGTSAFIATGLLVIIEKLFSDRDSDKKSPKKVMRGGSKEDSSYDKLYDTLAPISFNVFAKESFLKGMVKGHSKKSITQKK
jgi:hypothetical protein